MSHLILKRVAHPSCSIWKNVSNKIVDSKNYFVSDADDFEPAVKPAGPPAAFMDKWEGEDEDDDVKVSVFLEGHFQKFKPQPKVGKVFLEKLQIQDTFRYK